MIQSAQAGCPFPANLAGDTAGIGGGAGAILIRANAVPGQSWKLPGSERSTVRWSNTAAFVAPQAFECGNAGRNAIAGPGLLTFDISAAEAFRLAESVRTGLRGEFFNLLNRPDHSIVGRILNTPQFGVVQSQLPPRQIQFALKLGW